MLVAHALKREYAAGLRHTLDDHHARVYRVAREMPLKYGLADRYVFIRDDVFGGLELGHSVDEQKRISVREYFLDFNDVDHFKPCE